MIRINLLPHRQMRRAEKQREFGLMCVLVAVAAASLLFSLWTYVNSKINWQMQRNQRLQTEIAALDKEIAAISGLKTQIQHVLDRKQIVENLQSDRNQAVIVLDELARQLPEGTVLKSIHQQADLIELKGVADTNARVASLVHNLGESPFLQNPNLVEIKANESAVNESPANRSPDHESRSTVRQFEFVIKVSLKSPEKPNLDNPKPTGGAATPSHQG